MNIFENKRYELRWYFFFHSSILYNLANFSKCVRRDLIVRPHPQQLTRIGEVFEGIMNPATANHGDAQRPACAALPPLLKNAQDLPPNT